MYWRLILMTREMYNNSLKAGLVLSLTFFTAIAYVNVYDSSEEPPPVVEQYDVGPAPVDQHLAETGASDPDTFVITAYLAIDEYENRFHGITYSGVPAKANHTLAVDPKVIPLGSMVFIEGLGWWRAEDTGNMIKGKILDICVETRTQARNWGRQKRKVWILTPEQIEAAKATEKVELALSESGNIS